MITTYGVTIAMSNYYTYYLTFLDWAGILTWLGVIYWIVRIVLKGIK